MVDVPARLPHLRMHQNRGVETDHVGPETNIVPPPDPFDVVLQLDPERSIVPARSCSAIDLTRLEDEAASLAERNDHIHVHELIPPLSCPATRAARPQDQASSAPVRAESAKPAVAARRDVPPADSRSHGPGVPSAPGAGP